jgi:hypothetical protein
LWVGSTWPVVDLKPYPHMLVRELCDELVI